MHMSKVIRLGAGPALLGLAIVSQSAVGASSASREGSHGGRIPSSVSAEHKELHEELARVTRSGGRTAEAAKEVERLLQPHFLKEEKFALPPLGVLAEIAAGKMPANAREIITMSEHLKSELPTMLAEHGSIVKALEQLEVVGRNERKPEAARFAEKLKAHATQEEEILYPAAILAGEYLRLKQH